MAGSAGHCEPGVGRFTDPHPFTCSFFTPSLRCFMFGLCEWPLRARLGLLFLFCLSFARLFSLLRGGTGFLSSRFAAVLDSFTTGSHGPNRAGLLLRWCRFPTWLSKPHTAAHGGEFGFHRFFFVRLCSDWAVKSRSSLQFTASWIGRIV